MRRISRFSTVFAGLALLLSLLGAAGVGLPSGGRDALVTVVDLSPSCEPPDPLPDGALSFADSDLAGAMRRAAAKPGARRIRLLTDAVDPGSSEPSVPALPVDVELRPRRDNVRLLALRPPSRIPRDADFPVEITIGRTAGPARPPVEVTVDLLRDGERVGGEPQRVVLDRGRRKTLRIRDRVGRDGLVRYRARLSPSVGDGVDDVVDAVARVGDRPLVVAVGVAGGWAGFEVRPARPEELAAILAPEVDVVLLGGALSLAPAQEAVARAVREGAGLVVLGGGGMAGGPLDPLLPLTDVPPEGRAALLLLDYSGSMDVHKDGLIVGVGRLEALFAPGDQIAFLAFRHDVVARSDWSPVGDARWPLREIEARGNTRLLPAVLEATALLARLPDTRRRLFVVTDGEWADAEDENLVRALGELEAQGVHTAALFVKDPVPDAAAKRFARHARTGGDLAEALVRLEEEAPDRRIEEAVVAEVSQVPSWLRDALPPEGRYRGIERLYARGRGESIALRSGEVPLVGAWQPGGRVVVVAPDLSANPAVADAVPGLLRACARPQAKDGLRAWRDGGALLLEARDGMPADFTVDDVRLAAVPAGRGLWRARLESAPVGDVAIGFGDARLLLRGSAAAELEGLHNRPDVAASIARRSGGSLLPPESDAPVAPGRAVHAILLLSAVLVVAGAWIRRHA